MVKNGFFQKKGHFSKGLQSSRPSIGLENYNRQKILFDFSPNWTNLSILSHTCFFGLLGLFWPCGLYGLQRPKFLAFSGITKLVLSFEPIIKKLTHPNVDNNRVFPTASIKA